MDTASISFKERGPSTISPASWQAESSAVFAAELQAKLRAISPAQIDRLLRPARLGQPKKGLSATRPGTLLHHQVANPYRFSEQATAAKSTTVCTNGKCSTAWQSSVKKVEGLAP